MVKTAQNDWHGVLLQKYASQLPPWLVFSESELMFMFAICRRPSVCRLSSVCLSVVCLSSVCNVLHPTRPIEIFGNVSAPFNTLVPDDIQVKFYGDRPRGTPPPGG